MYVISRNIKILSFSLIVLGLMGIGYGFYNAPKTIEESKEMIANMHHDSHSSDSHAYDSHSSDDYIHRILMLMILIHLMIPTTCHMMNMYFIS